MGTARTLTAALAFIIATAGGVAQADRTAEPTVLAGILWSHGPGCAAVKDAFSRRQCQVVRKSRQAVAARERLIVRGDSAAISVGPYDLVRRAVPVTVFGCIACTAPAGALGYLTTGSPSVQDGVVRGPVLAQTWIPQPSAQAARQWRLSVASRLIVDWTLRIRGPGAPWRVSQTRGVAVTPVAWRAFDPCTGDVVAGSRGAGTTPDPDSCPRGARVVAAEPPPAPAARAEATDGEPELEPDGDEGAAAGEGGATEETTAGGGSAQEAADEDPALPERPSVTAIRDVVRALQPKVEACRTETTPAGPVELGVVLQGDGVVRAAGARGALARDPARSCVEDVVKRASFPRFRREAMSLRISFTLPPAR